MSRSLPSSPRLGRLARLLAPVGILVASVAPLHADPADSAPDTLPVYSDRSDLLVYVDRGRERRVRTPTNWERRRAHILAGMERVMGPLPRPAVRPPLDVRVLESVSTPRYVRRKITFVADPGDRVPAYLLLPRLEGRRPAMLCLHQTTPLGKAEPAGLGGSPTLRYAHELAERGYVCLVPDYPAHGDYAYVFGTDSAYASGSMKAVWNNIRAIDVLDSLPEADPKRIGAIGHSLGGHNALFTAVFDPRVRAVVVSCAFTPFRDYQGGDLSGWTSDRYMPRIREVYGNDPAAVPFDFPEVVAALAPRALFVSAPLHDHNFDVGGVRRAIAAAAPVYRLLRARGDRLTAVHPDAGHDFPDEVREQAYAWLDRMLK